MGQVAIPGARAHHSCQACNEPALQFEQRRVPVRLDGDQPGVSALGEADQFQWAK